MSRINGFVGRRNFLRVVGASGAGIATIAAGSSIIGASQVTAKKDAPGKTAAIKAVNPSEALKRLLDGNNRFVMQKSTYYDQSVKSLKELANSQSPFACVLGCADSRVPAEILFDQGFGDIFSVRVAGNIASDEGIASLEYSTLSLGTQLIVVLGHQSCGAVAAALTDDPFPGRIGYLVESIKPIIARAESKNAKSTLDDAISTNIRHQVQTLKESSTVLTKLLQEDKLKIIGAVFDFNTGKVKVIA